MPCKWLDFGIISALTGILRLCIGGGVENLKIANDKKSWK